MKRLTAVAIMVLVFLLTAPNPFAPLRTFVQERDSREGRIVNPDSSGWHLFAKNHADKRCGTYFFREDSSLRFVFSRWDTARKSVVAKLALADSVIPQVVQGAPTAIEVSSRKFIIRTDSVTSSCLYQMPPP